MQRLFRIIFIVVTFHSILGFVSSDVFAGKYNHDDFSLEVPDGWVEMKTDYPDVVEVVFTKEIDAEITPIMMIAIGDKVERSSINDLVEKAAKTITSLFPGAKFLFERDVYTGNVKWQEIIYQYSDAGYSFQVVQYHTINNRVHYAFTGQCLQTDFREHLTDFRKTFNTWKFTSDRR